MPFKIRTKLIVAFMALISGILIITGLIGYYNISASDRAVHKVEAIAEEIIVIGDLQHSLEHVLMPPNDYLITGDRKYIDDFNVSSKRVQEAFKKTDELLGHLEAFGLPHVEEERKTLKDVKTAWLNIKELSLEILSIPNPIGNKDGAIMMEEMDYRWGGPATELIHKWQKGDVEEYKEAVELAEKARRTSWVIMGSAGTLLLILGVSFALFYSKIFVRPIEKLHHAADAIAGGDFKSRVDVKTGDEIEQLSNAMNEMAEKLDNFYGSLENQVMERTRELRESEERFRVIAETATDAILCMRPPGVLTLWNKSAERVFGYAADEVIGKYLHDIIVPERYREKSLEGLKGFFEMGTGSVVGKTIEVFGLRKDGSEFSVELSISAMRIKDEWQAAAIVRDITERKEVEAAFRALVGTAVANIGSAFFHETVSSLCTWLGVECVIIGELVDGGMVRALAMQVDGKAVEYYEYALAGTPCESATEKGYCEYHEGVVQLFPADKDLVDIRAEAYVGTPTRDKNGKVNGILCAISRHKFVPPPMVKDVFAIIAARAGTEIERKKAEAQLKNSEERYRQIIQTSMDGFWITDTKGRILDVNDAYCQLVGYAREELLNMRIPDVEAKETPEETAQHIQEVMTKGSVRFETRHRRKDGLLLDIEVSVVHRPDKEDGCFIIFLRDITQRKQAEAELRLRAQLLDSVSDTIFVLDFNGNFIYLNEATWKTRGYTRDEMMGINLHVLDTPKYEKLIDSRMRDLMEKGRCTFESEHRRKDGSIMQVEINAQLIELGGRKLVLSTIRDITERKRMDEELQLTNFALNHAVDSVFFMEPSGKFLYVNETACRVLGYSKEELLSMSVADIDPNLPEGVPLEMSQATKKAGIGRVESEHRAKDGRLIPVEIIVAYLQYKGEDFHCSFVRDITERKRAEEELAKHVNELERYMKATVQREFRIKELRDRVEELEKRLKG